MRLVATLVLFAPLAVAACRDDHAGTATTTSHVMIPEPTAIDQSDEPRDRALVARIRRDLVLDRSLSVRAKSVVVVVRDGVATLRGDVPDRAEHDRVVALVVSVPGVVRVDDRLVSTKGP